MNFSSRLEAVTENLEVAYGLSIPIVDFICQFWETGIQLWIDVQKKCIWEIIFRKKTTNNNNMLPSKIEIINSFFSSHGANVVIIGLLEINLFYIV